MSVPAGFLSDDQPTFTASAPGRLDVMGGIADYSGATVLELPLGCGTTARVQRQAAARCDVTTRRGAAWQTFGTDELPDVGDEADAAALGRVVRERSGDHWPAYVLGVIGWCRRRFPGGPPGLRVAIESSVPEGKGVASSAALEVAVMRAVLAALGQDLPPEAVAAACQWVENHVVGAPCGIMDQMTSACGRRDHLLRLRCQPATIEAQVPVPAGWRFYGIDSGERHAVTGADYATVRTAAFMGRRIIAEARGSDDHLANIAPGEFAARWEAALPERMTGREFLARYGGTADRATAVDARRAYRVRVATRHPVEEQARVTRFAELLARLPGDPAAAREAGALMVESHRSYGACGLGSVGTDRLVDLVMREGPERGLFGAKITGGGSGGTVAVLGTAAADAVVRQIATSYRAQAGHGGAILAA